MATNTYKNALKIDSLMKVKEIKRKICLTPCPKKKKTRKQTFSVFFVHFRYFALFKKMLSRFSNIKLTKPNEIIPK
jgi:hypothetical protein